jgi:hypothetical protein
MEDKQNPQSEPVWQRDAFPQPRTISGNWDLSEMLASPQTPLDPPVTCVPDEACFEIGAEEDPAEATEDWPVSFDPFPKPNTIPGKWDTSAFR